MYLTCDLPAPPLYPDEMRENIIPQVPLFGILNKFNGLAEKEYKTYKDSTLKRFEITQLPPFIILCIKVHIAQIILSCFFPPPGDIMISHVCWLIGSFVSSFISSFELMFVVTYGKIVVRRS